MFDFALFFVLAASTLQIDESRMTNPAMPHQSSSLAGGLGLCAQNWSGSSASNASDEGKDDHKSGSLMFGLSLANAWLGLEAAGIVVIRVLIAGIRGRICFG